MTSRLHNHLLEFARSYVADESHTVKWLSEEAWVLAFRQAFPNWFEPMSITEAFKQAVAEKMFSEQNLLERTVYFPKLSLDPTIEAQIQATKPGTYDVYTDESIPESPKTPLQLFDAAREITTERGKAYGHPAKDFAKVAAVKSILATCPDPLVRHTLEMIAVKMARLVETPTHLDSWIDIAGYARCGVMILDQQASQSKTDCPHMHAVRNRDGLHCYDCHIALPESWGK